MVFLFQNDCRNFPWFFFPNYRAFVNIDCLFEISLDTKRIPKKNNIWCEKNVQTTIKIPLHHFHIALFISQKFLFPKCKCPFDVYFSFIVFSFLILLFFVYAFFFTNSTRQTINYRLKIGNLAFKVLTATWF